MNIKDFIDTHTNTLALQFPNDNQEKLKSIYYDCLEFLFNIRYSSLITENELANLDYLQTVSSSFLMNKFDSNHKKHVKNILFLGFYFLVEQRFIQITNEPSTEKQLLIQLKENSKTLWQQNLNFQFLEIVNYYNILTNFKSWIDVFEIEFQDLATTQQQLLYLFFIINFAKQSLPNPVPPEIYNTYWFASPQKLKIDFLEMIRANINDYSATIYNKIKLTHMKIESVSRKDSTSSSIEIVNLDDYFSTPPESDFDDDIYFDANMYPNLEEIASQLSEQLEEFELITSNILKQNLKEIILIQGESELYAFFQTNYPKIISSLECIQTSFLKLQEDHFNTIEQQEKFQRLISVLFEHLALKLKSSFKLPKNLAVIRENLIKDFKYQNEQLLNDLDLFFQNLDNCYFFSLTWFSHLWFYFTSTIYRETYNRLKETINNNNLNHEKIEAIKDIFKIKSFYSIDKFFNQEKIESQFSTEPTILVMN